MALDWKNVRDLKPALQTTSTDVILSGHGYLATTETTVVPPGIEFWVLAPPGASIADATGQALEDMSLISKLGIKNPGSDVLVNNIPVVYREGSKAPNYILQAPNGIVIKPGGPHIIGVTSDTALIELWQRVAVFVKPGQVIRCFWAACTAMAGAKNQVVVYQ
jgi:hypothetical protein